MRIVARANLKEKHFMLIQIFGLFGGLSLVITFSLDMGLFFFFFGCAGSSLLYGLFSGCSEWGLLSSCSAELLIVVAPLVAEHRL